MVIIDTPFHLIGLLLNSNAPELKPYFTNPPLTSDNNKPRNVVLIIGESFWKKHSSLYGYEKPTNPLLEHLEKDSSVFIFNNITSAETHTQEAFKNLLSTFSSHSENTIKWYEHTTLNEIVSLMDYKSYWISNQLRKGAYDNIVSRYAELCDHQLYTQGENGFKDPKFDIDIIPLIKSLKKAQYCFHIVNLMGSHAKFSSRFPMSFAKFNAKDYMEHPEHQRQTLADYDNSILYNDYVVSEIINLFKDKEAIVVYLSDHSIDLFQSDPNYAAHAKTGNAISEKVSKEIPFMIYMSRVYQEKYPEMVEAVKRNLDSSFRTDDLIYTMMDIMGCDFADKPMRSRSLLRQK